MRSAALVKGLSRATRRPQSAERGPVPRRHADWCEEERQPQTGAAATRRGDTSSRSSDALISCWAVPCRGCGRDLCRHMRMWRHTHEAPPIGTQRSVARRSRSPPPSAVVGWRLSRFNPATSRAPSAPRPACRAAAERLCVGVGDDVPDLPLERPAVAGRARQGWRAEALQEAHGSGAGVEGLRRNPNEAPPLRMTLGWVVCRIACQPASSLPVQDRAPCA